MSRAPSAVVPERRVAVVTGAASGIGAATVSHLRRAGAQIFALDIDGDALNGMSAAVPTGIIRPICLDITDMSALEDAARQIVLESGSVNWLVNNAGGGAGMPLVTMRRPHWDAMLALNLTSAFETIRLLRASMPRGAAIVNVSSLAARYVSPKGGAAYAAAKAGVVALTRQAAAEFAPLGLRVNCVLPGPVRSALTACSRRRDEDFPLGRWVTPDDVAAAIHFLLSEESSMCTGAELVVDGGTSLRL